MSAYTRLLVIGTDRKASMVVPADEPLASHLATLADVVAEPHRSTRLAVVDASGTELDTAASLDELGLTDGAQLRLVRSDEVPAPPEVTDVTDAVAQERAALTRGWTDAHRVALASWVAGAAAFAGASAARPDMPWLPLALWAVAIAGAVISGLMRRAQVRAVSTGIAVGSAVALASTLTAWADAAGGFLETAAVAAALVWASLALGRGWGGRDVPAGLGSLAGALLAGAAATALLLGAEAAATVAIVGVVALLGLGLVPSVALSVAGLTRLDDAADAGHRPARPTVAAGVASAYAVMTWSVAALSVTAGASVLVLLATGELWPQLVAGALVAIVLLRTRVMALAPQAWSLWAAGILGTGAGLWLAGDHVLLAALAAVAAVAALVGAASAPPQHRRIRLRRWGDVAEALCAIAIVPCVVGLFGVYGAMLEVFS